MNRFQSLAVWGLVAGLACWAYWWSEGTAQNAAAVGGLPGAKVVIEAARYPSIQAAIDALPASGGIVKLPPGEFEIREPLVIRTEDTMLVGAGSATHIKNVNTDGDPALVVAHAELGDPRRDREHQLWRVQLADFRITGNPESGPGIAARQINEIFIHGVTVSHHGDDGIVLDYCYEDPRISNCLITYNQGTGVNLQGCHDIVVIGNQFEENNDALHCFDGYNLCMTGNCLDDHLGRGVVIENTYGSVVSGNMIEECAAEAIVLDRDCYGITLSANVIAHNGGGIDLRDAHGCAVSANTFTIMKTAALRVGPASGRIAVSGNSFSNSYIGDGEVRRGTNDLAAAGLVLDGASDVGITGNVFSSVEPKALELTENKATGVLFRDNLIVDSASDHGQLPPVAADNLE